VITISSRGKQCIFNWTRHSQNIKITLWHEKGLPGIPDWMNLIS